MYSCRYTCVGFQDINVSDVGDTCTLIKYTNQTLPRPHLFMNVTKTNRIRAAGAVYTLYYNHNNTYKMCRTNVGYIIKKKNYLPPNTKHTHTHRCTHADTNTFFPKRNNLTGLQ